MTSIQDKISQSYLGRRRARPPAWALTFLSVCALGAAGCRAQECADLDRAWRQLSAPRAPDAPPRKAPIVMSAQIHESRLDAWWQEALDGAGRTLRWDQRAKGGELRGRLHLRRAWLRAADGPCAQGACLAIGWEGSLELSAALGGLTLFQGQTKLTGQGRAPLRLTPDAQGTALRLSLADATLDRLSLDLSLPEAWRPAVDGFARDGVQAALQAAGPDLTLARWAPLRWEGAALTALPARLAALPDARSLWIGFSTDLPTSPGAPSLQPASALQPGEEVAVSFSGEALTGLLRLLLQEGLLPARLDDDFKPDPDGIHRVTLARAQPQDGHLDLDLTLWRLAADEAETCYAAQARGRALFHVKQGGQLDLTLDDLQVVSTQGEDTLLRLGLWWQSAFFEQSLSAQASFVAARTLQLGPLGRQRLTARRVSSQPGLVSVALAVGED